MRKEIAEKLLEIEAVFLQPNDPFTWSSGIQSPVYCDNRLTLAYPQLRKQIATGLADLVSTHFPEAEVVAGTATAGIPHAAWVSDVLDLPMSYVRSKAKKHGKGNQIEGAIQEGQKVVVIEDLISTGGSSINAVKALEEAGCEVLGVVSIFTYELAKSAQAFEAEGIEVYSLSDFHTLLEVAVEKKIIDDKEFHSLQQWCRNPLDWKTP
ncbi:orotate phosphoribosyltransferase [Bacillus spongiae]|uniref:Orotate phosphoribosyltransferase n=1 Tax=Bacillus spongiae TaxID=2683610 RepID=A0ABU8HA26_9BACI